ncbi:hypothetical protein Lal_00004049, partial [Lupinus albus]
ERESSESCWIKITGLPQEYWCPTIIFSIAGGIGSPIALDAATSNISFGHFARILVDVNLMNVVPNQILVERDGFEFLVGIEVVKPVAKSAETVPSQEGFNLVIDLEIEKSEEVVPVGLERLILHQEDNVERVVENIEPRMKENQVMANENANFIVTDDLPNPVAARDMSIVGRLWAEEEEVEESSEEEPFVEVQSKAQQKKTKKKMQGFGNAKTRLVLKNYYLENKPDLVHPLFWAALKLKGFGFNERGTMKPNLWGLCSTSLNPQVIGNSNQHIISALEVENKQRRQLWADIISLMSVHKGPWCCIGDFNVVLGAHECRGPNLPPRSHSEEFKLFTDVGSFIHLGTIGADFTWTNRRIGLAETEERLDKSICNEDWMSTWNQISCSTLPRIASDHHPLLLCFSLAIIPRFSSFKFHKVWLSNVDCQRVVAEVWRVEVVGCPLFVLSQKLKLLKKELKTWNYLVFGNIHERGAPLIKEVVWFAPMPGWIKINSDGAAKGASGLAGGGSIFRDHNGDYLGGFTDFFGTKDS